MCGRMRLYVYSCVPNKKIIYFEAKGLKFVLSFDIFKGGKTIFDGKNFLNLEILFLSFLQFLSSVWYHLHVYHVA